MKKVSRLTYAKNSNILSCKTVIMLKMLCEIENYCFCSNNVCAILLTLIDEMVTDCITTFKLLY